MKTFLPILIFFSSSLIFAQNTAPVLDGNVEEQEWQDAQNFSLDYEVDPGDNTPPPHKTKAYIKYTKTDLYIGFIAYADMKNLRSSIRNRDEGFRDDNVLFGFDAYGDGRYMIALGANPEGNQIDVKVLSNGGDDNYDVNFESRASKHQDNYQVELKIPFANLQFKPAEEMRWKVVFARSTYTDNTRSQSINFPIDRNNPCLVCQTPDEIILKGVEAKNRVNLLPYVFGGLSDDEAMGKVDYGKPLGNVGLSGLFDLNSVTSLEFALNPDFSQVEADVSQVNANTTFALFFPERRPYFNEGNEIINSNLNTVYTRTVNDPLASTKLIHQGDKHRVYWLAAYDQASPYLVAGENESYDGEGGKAFSNIFSYQRTFDKGAYIGLLSTNRIFEDGGNGHAVGLNGLLRFKELYTLNFELNTSIIKEPVKDWIDSEDQIRDKTVALDGEKKQGNAFLFSLERNTRNWNTEFYYVHYSPHYETPLGFVTQNSIRNMQLTHNYTYYPEDKEGLIQQLNVNLGSELTFNYNSLRKYFDVFSNTFVQWKANWRTSFNLIHIINEEFVGFVGRNMTEVSMFNGYNPSENINLRAFVSFSESIRYEEDDPSVGKAMFIGSFNNFQITPKLLFTPSIRYSELRSKEDNSLYFKGYIGRLNINYQFNQNLSFRLIGEYNDFDKVFFVQPLLKWNPSPFTIFYIGGTNGYSRIENRSDFQVDNSQLYLKFQYQFDL
ncbi:MAG: hypothetical protein ABF269_08630 [Candidatus Arcticimaribacter sp.]